MTVWDLVIGHADAVTTLRGAVASGRVSHAWLFTGPPGVGKLHTARVLAAALNCPDGGCGQCAICGRVLRGVHPDVHLIVPEGENLLVDDIRAVREEASRSRHEASYAVFLVDEADRMTDAAANALLKVLEEPPPAVVFVLVARSAEALVATIPSRARPVPFATLAAGTIAAALAAELGSSGEQVAWAAAASHGRLARARALLTDEGARLRRSRTLELLGTLGSGRSADALGATGVLLGIGDEVMAAAKERQAAELDELEEAYGRGRGTGAMRRRLETRHRRELRRARFDAIRDALADLLSAYRDAALLAAAPDPAAYRQRLTNPDRAEGLGRLAAGIGTAAALRAAAVLEEADRRLAIGAAPQLTLEAALHSLQAALSGARPPLQRLVLR